MSSPARCLLFIIPLALISEAVGGIHPRLQRVIDPLLPDEQVVAWVYFTDKGPNEALRNSVPLSVVSQRSLQRRQKARPPESIVDYSDLPVDQEYVDGIRPLVIRIRQQTKWFNGISVVATKSQIIELASLPFVREVELVARFRRSPELTEPSAAGDQPSSQPDGIFSFNYGSSFNQNNQINVPAVHDLGNYGQGVVVGVFDNGFRLLTHEAFDSLRSRIIATYDFVDHKVSVVPNNPSTSFGAHGVNTLSTIGGFKSGQLIGPAFGATYILARTENDSSETPMEEDNWVAAIEWADSIGVDVTSTSLGYLSYDSPYTSWTWEDMDGNTTAITRAADIAVSKGIIVVNSAGNEGYNASHNTLGAPADGDSVLSVGAVTSAGVRSSFSSVGPTTSVPPRIKPDVMAQGSTVRVASATNTASYGSTQGTSFSCPLAAGVAALIVHARPTDSPMEIMNAMRATASNASTPNNLIGWGILNALAALTPSPVVPQFPANGTVNQSTPPSLVWTKSNWASTYRLQVAQDSLFAMLAYNDSTLSDTTAIVNGLAAGTTYYWRVYAKNQYGTSAATPSWSFTTLVSVPPVPVLISPVDGAVDQSASLSLSWTPSPGATSYHIQIAIDSVFNLVVVEDSSLTITSTVASGLANGVTYFWRVQARSIAGISPFSDPWRFTTVVAAPLAPTLVMPANGATGVEVGTNLVWNSTIDASTYEIRLSNDSTFANTIHDTTVTDTTFSPAQLSAGVRFFWQVRAMNAGGESPWSEAWHFITSGFVARGYVVHPGWNLISLPLDVENASVPSVFPTAVSPAYGFTRFGYERRDTLSRGVGYWVKFGAADTVLISGVVRLRDTIAVTGDWNLIGSISSTVDVSEIIEIPSGISASEYYEYFDGYSVSQLLQPGLGYWVKCTQTGVLVLQSSTPDVVFQEP